MSAIYEVTLEKEVLHEYSASLNARYFHYLHKHGIDWKDESNPVALLDNEIIDMYDPILFCNTLDELKVFEDRLKELRDEIEKLEEEDKCRRKGLRGTLKNNSAKPLTMHTKSLQKTHAE